MSHIDRKVKVKVLFSDTIRPYWFVNQQLLDVKHVVWYFLLILVKVSFICTLGGGGGHWLELEKSHSENRSARLEFFANVFACNVILLHSSLHCVL